MILEEQIFKKQNDYKIIIYNIKIHTTILMLLSDYFHKLLFLIHLLNKPLYRQRLVLRDNELLKLSKLPAII